MSAALWEHAPATREIKLAPVRAILLAREKMADWQKIIGHCDALILMPDVSPADKMTLGLERMAASVGRLACERIITEAEAESARQVGKLQHKWGWML
jgi:hypothetical protein